ncbi:MAG: hypothetical protein IPN26_09385 [Bacteroidetes bacterium]|nr:hypothetical protein [Bacteroidota bacterium]
MNLNGTFKEFEARYSSRQRPLKINYSFRKTTRSVYENMAGPDFWIGFVGPLVCFYFRLIGKRKNQSTIAAGKKQIGTTSP